jgi:hypothetical protein
MADPTDAQIDAGAIALFAANNANGDIAYVESRWPNYSDMLKAPYLRWSRAVLIAALNIPDTQGA